MFKHKTILFESTREMAGYCISLFKYMRIDENLNKKEKLLNTRNQVTGYSATEHEKFLAFGEFDRIGFEKVTRFSRFRDISDKSRSWIGDRQTLLVYDIPETEYKDKVFYEKGNFYIRENGTFIQADKLFLGITILQFKDSQKEKQDQMSDFLLHCKEKILELAAKDMPHVACSVLGTLGSFGLVILWLADQYCDVLHMVTKIRNTDIGEEKRQDNRSIFLSAYTIFAQNHRYGTEWDKKIKEIKGEAALRLTLKKGASDKILEALRKWQIEQTEIYHSAGEHDIVIRMKSAETFNLFSDGGELNSKGDFVKENVLQLNLQLCEDIRDSENKDFLWYEGVPDEENSKQEKVQKAALPELDRIQKEYRKLREQFKCCFPSTAGMVDTLDWLYSDYIAKISTASNEMWVSNFSYQFMTILECLTKFVDNLDNMELSKKDALQIINDLLSDFERQISHIAESNNLILGTPICQFRYSGQNNLTLYAYFGIIKSILNAIYEKQEVSSQAEIVPLIVADIVPIIKSNLFINYHNRNDARVITINLPMMSLYDPVCYYPYLLHEIFHYVVPNDRLTRNETLGCLMAVEMLNSICKDIFIQKLQLKTNQEIEQMNLLFKDCVLPYSYSFMVEWRVNNAQIRTDNNETYHDIDEKALTADEYELKIFDRWCDWINAEEWVDLNGNPIYLFLCYLYNKREQFGENVKRWEAARSGKAEYSESIMVKELTDFVDSLEGIADNPVSETQDSNFAALMSYIGEDVFKSTVILLDSIREALVDIAMVTMGNMDFAEYLLLFTKIKKELLLDCEEPKEDTQDIIRLGMVLDHLCGEEDEDNLTGVLDNSKEAFINMYCGLYFCMHKPDADQKFVDRFCRQAEKWFAYWRICFQNYMLRYRIYAVFFKQLQGQLLKTVDRKEKQEDTKESIYWKRYAKELRNYGNYIRSYCGSYNDPKTEEQWNERRSAVDEQIFDLNIELVHKFQYQETFAQLNEKREKRIEKVEANLYESQNYSYEKFKIPGMLSEQDRISKFQLHFWKYEIGDVGQLGNLTAMIAEKLKQSNSRLLGKNEYPVWYRGQQSAEYKLIPSIMRKYKNQKSKQKRPEDFTLMSFIRREFEEFRFRADGSQEAIERVGYSEGDYIALMQHYSVASNFLDWTEDALSALYFALEGFLDENREKTDKDAALYIFSPALYNYVRKKMILRAGKDKRRLELEKDVVNTLQESIPNLSVAFNKGKYNMYMLGEEKYWDDNSTPYSNEAERDKKLAFYLPLAIYISRLNKRIQAQNGIFLAYSIYTSPDDNDEFDYISLERIQEYYLKTFTDDDEICPFLYKIIIKKEEREKIASWVRAFGMTKEKCYPELSNIGERIMK